MWTLGSYALPGLLKTLSVPVPENCPMFLFAVRGAVTTADTGKRTNASMDGRRDFDHLQMRCTIGQWFTEEGLMAVYRGSTVPHDRSIDRAVERNGQGANMVFPGLYTFNKGKHRAGTATGHDALRELSPKVICRTADDDDYEFGTDLIEIDSPADNTHAAWNSGSSQSFSSAGCIVVSGRPDSGQWKVFKDRAYAQEQAVFPMLILHARHWVYFLNSSEPGIINGSRGERAKAVQEALIDRGFLEGEADGVFGPKSTLALIKFQRKQPSLSVSGVCAPSTAARLKITDW